MYWSFVLGAVLFRFFPRGSRPTLSLDLNIVDLGLDLVVGKGGRVKSSMISCIKFLVIIVPPWKRKWSTRLMVDFEGNWRKSDLEISTSRRAFSVSDSPSEILLGRYSLKPLLEFVRFDLNTLGSGLRTILGRRAGYSMFPKDTQYTDGSWRKIPRVCWKKLKADGISMKNSAQICVMKVDGWTTAINYIIILMLLT